MEQSSQGLLHSIDYVSSGRLILGVGHNHPPKEKIEFFGEDSDAIIHAEKLNENPESLEDLWGCKPFIYDGMHYEVTEVTFCDIDSSFTTNGAPSSGTPGIKSCQSDAA